MQAVWLEWRRHQQPSAVPPRADHLRRQSDDVAADGRRPQHADFPLLSDLRLHRVLGERRLSRNVRRCDRQLRDPNFPAPTIAVWEEARHPWVSLPPDTPPKRIAKQG